MKFSFAWNWMNWTFEPLRSFILRTSCLFWNGTHRKRKTAGRERVSIICAPRIVFRARGPLSQSYDFQMRALRVMQRYPPTTVFCKLFVHRSKLIVSENLNSSREAKIVLNYYSIHLRGFFSLRFSKVFVIVTSHATLPGFAGYNSLKRTPNSLF